MEHEIRPFWWMSGGDSILKDFEVFFADTQY